MSTLAVNSIIPANAGSEDYFLSRAWVNFNGTGTVAIRADGNVSSITDLGTGTYTVNITTALADTNFAAVFGREAVVQISSNFCYEEMANRTTTSIKVVSGESAALADSNNINVAIVR